MLRIDDLAGKSILITGANSGIGAAISRAFAEQGARLALHWNSNAAGAQRVLQSVRDAGSVAELIQGDLTRDGEAARYFTDRIKVGNVEDDLASIHIQRRQSFSPDRSIGLSRFSSQPNVTSASKASTAAGIAPARITSLSTIEIPRKMYSPSPPAPMAAAIVASPTEITVATRTPAMMTPNANGSST